MKYTAAHDEVRLVALDDFYKDYKEQVHLVQWNQSRTANSVLSE